MGTKSIIVVGFLSLLGACTDDPDQTKMQYFPDMADTPGIKTQANYIDPPEGSVARTAILYPDTPEEAEQILKNPLVGQSDEAKHAEEGKELFRKFCSPCHGNDGKGNGSIVDKFPRPPDLTQDLYKNRQDGFFFYRITFGSALMPSYGHAITAKERWQIVLNIRNKQKGLDGTSELKKQPEEKTDPAAPTQPTETKPAEKDGK